LTHVVVSQTLHAHTVGVRLRAALELLKPITWFPPMWAFGCGAVAAGMTARQLGAGGWVGLVLTGPLVCAASQAVNDWYDQEVDAVNEPHRPIPSGRLPRRWAIAIAIGWSALSLLVGFSFGAWGAVATALALLLAWAYSAPPFRLKANGWWGNLACGLAYETLAWITGAAIALGGAAPDGRTLLLAVLYGIGAHGIMALNDYKALEGDRRLGVRSLPVQLGPRRAALVSGATMLGAQLAVVVLLLLWNRPAHAVAVAALAAVQLPLLRRFVRTPDAREALRVSAAGVPLYVLGMMASALALRSLAAGG
jgi:chlorophyll synthase